LFYAVCQAVMLIFCFRWRAFASPGHEKEREREGETVIGEMELEMESDGEVGVEEDGREGEGGKWIRDLDILQRAITSDLNPLLGCNTTVVNTFAKVAHFTNFAYCFSIIEANQQSTTRSGSSHSLSTTGPTQGGRTPSVSRMNSTNTISSGGMGMNTHTSSYSVPRKARQANIDAGLDSYYPFDPFTLPQSKRYIDKIYRTWGEVSIPLDEDDDDDDDDEEEEEESESESDEGMDVDIRKKFSLPKHATGGGTSWNEARRRLKGGRDDGLSSSLEGMSISPGQTGFLRR
jgi:RNA polymerase I-specific transcription initiation factor RRN3